MPSEVSWLDVERAADVDAALALLRTEFPETARERLVAQARGPASRVAIARDAAGAIVGAAAAEPLSDDLRAFEVFGEDAILPLRGIRIGVLSSAVVDAAHRQRGLGHALALALIEWLRTEGCEWLVATSLKRSGPNPSQPGLERIGFAPVARVDGPTYRRANLGGGVCPHCGEACTCSAVLMVTPLHALRIY